MIFLNFHTWQKTLGEVQPGLKIPSLELYVLGEAANIPAPRPPLLGGLREAQGPPCTRGPAWNGAVSCDPRRSSGGAGEGKRRGDF